MSVLKREKPYKACPPEETVRNIKDILASKGIKISEELFYNADADVYSCNVYIANEGLDKLRIGTNGKGMTKEYSLASGYAEFMERYQCGILTGVPSDKMPDAVKVKTAEFENEIKDFFRDNFGENEKASKTVLSLYDEMTLVPFFTYSGDEKILVPIDMLLTLTTSNGMCAGNSKIEAVIQGVSEIFERYAQKKIMLEKLCPPAVPDSWFDDTEILEKLTKLKAKGIKYEIRDCSLGMGLPVIGIYMEIEDERSLFHLGADPSPITALERCVTEIFQGVDNINDAEFHEAHDTEEDDAFWKYQLQLCSWGGNIYPNEIRGKNPSWEFKGFSHTVSKSNEDDLSYYLKVISSLDKKLYIRDCSYYGFPSYFCYIPGLSGIDFSYDEGEELAGFLCCGEKLKAARKLPLLNKKEIKEFALTYREFLDDFWYYENENFARRFFPKGSFPAEIKGLDYILAKIYAAAHLREDAADAMENYLLTADDDDYEYAEKFIISMRCNKNMKKYEISPSEFPVCENCAKCMLKSNCFKANFEIV